MRGEIALGVGAQLAETAESSRSSGRLGIRCDSRRRHGRTTGKIRRTRLEKNTIDVFAVSATKTTIGSYVRGETEPEPAGDWTARGREVQDKYAEYRVQRFQTTMASTITVSSSMTMSLSSALSRSRQDPGPGAIVIASY